MAKPIVLFGGTFDPIHHGHLIAAMAVAEHFGFEKVTFVPVMVPPHKPGGAAGGSAGGVAGAGVPCSMASAADRLEMVRLAVAGAGMLDVSDIELRRSPPSYTFDTLTSLRREHGPDADLCWVVGADMLADLPTWRKADKVVEMARIITVARPPYSRRISATLDAMAKRFTSEQVSRLADGVVSTPLIDISSSLIRRRIGRGRSIRYLTPDAVIDHIGRQGLYVAAPEGAP